MLTAPRLIQAFSRMWAYVTISERDALWVWLRAFAGVNSDGSTRTPCSMYALDCHDHRSGSGEDTFFFLTAYPSSDNTLLSAAFNLAQLLYADLNMAVDDIRSLLCMVVSSRIGNALEVEYTGYFDQVVGLMERLSQCATLPCGWALSYHMERTGMTLHSLRRGSSVFFVQSCPCFLRSVLCISYSIATFCNAPCGCVRTSRSSQPLMAALFIGGHATHRT